MPCPRDDAPKPLASNQIESVDEGMYADIGAFRLLSRNPALLDYQGLFAPSPQVGAVLCTAHISSIPHCWWDFDHGGEPQSAPYILRCSSNGTRIYLSSYELVSDRHAFFRS